MIHRELGTERKDIPHAFKAAEGDVSDRYCVTCRAGVNDARHVEWLRVHEISCHTRDSVNENVPRTFG